MYEPRPTQLLAATLVCLAIAMPAAATAEESAPPTSEATRSEGEAESALPPPASEPAPVRRAESKSIWDKIKLGTVWYLAYGGGRESKKWFNQTKVGRGYVTLKIKAKDWFEPRVTFDSHQDDAGDWKVRLKYLYGKFKVPVETTILTEPNLEFGIVHTPWFDFEEHVNWYRNQGTMFIERNKIMNSADLGFTLGGLLGEKLSKEYQKKVNKKYPGKYGSFALGVYNGGGYHAKETNQNKVFESRLSLRPLGFILPNLQISHLFIHGKGNTRAQPDWQVQDIMASFEHEYFVLTGQWAGGRGNQKGNKVDANGDALGFVGYSGFLEIKLPAVHTSLIGRYDYWDWRDVKGDDVGIPTSRMIGGIAYHFLGHSMILIDYDRSWRDDDDLPVDWQARINLQVYVP